MDHTRRDFPDDFVFGTATSAYQIEGDAKGGAGPCHWDSFARTPGNVAGAATGAVACDHLTHWAADLDLVRDAGFDAYRFSTSWARLLPEGRGQANKQGLAFYDELIDGMLERGLKPAATLYHWEMPQPLVDQGGWRSPDSPNWFAEFTDLIATQFGDRLWSVAPINEPYCVTWLGHFAGVHAPGLRDIHATARSIHNVLKSHGTAIQVMRAHGMSNLGAVCNFELVIAGDDSAAAHEAAARHDAIHNALFASAIHKGAYPDAVLAGLEPYLPAEWFDDMDTIAEPIDWQGVNYYSCRRIVADEAQPWPALKAAPAQPPLTQMGWEIEPEGLHHFLTRVSAEYTGDMPLYVTENGIAKDDAVGPDGTVDDSARVEYIDSHLGAVRRAIDDGAPVKGYFAWSLMDNYEWAQGYGPRFGLVHVNYDTLERTPKASWHAMQAMLS